MPEAKEATLAPTNMIEWAENVLIGTVRHLAGTTDKVSDSERDLYVNKLGWAKCCATGDQGERASESVTVAIDSVQTTLA